MRDLVVTENITLDGVIDAAAGWFTPDDPDQDLGDLQEVTAAHSAAADAFLCGRVTFEQMRGYWPQQTDDTTGVTDYLNAVQKYVVSSRLDDPEWENSTVLRTLDDVRALKHAAGRDIVVTGSLTLVPQLMHEALVDEYRLFVYPVVLGEGQRLFGETSGITPLHLVESRSFRSGVVLLRYRVD